MVVLDILAPTLAMVILMADVAVVVVKVHRDLRQPLRVDLDKQFHQLSIIHIQQELVLIQLVPVQAPMVEVVVPVLVQPIKMVVMDIKHQIS